MSATAAPKFTLAEADQMMVERIATARAEYSARLAEARAATAAHHAEMGSPFGLTPAQAAERHERVKGVEKAFRRQHRQMLVDAKRDLNDVLVDAKRENKAWHKEIKKAAKR